MHANGCINGTLADVFPSMPIHDSISMNVNADVANRMKYLALNFPSASNSSSSTYASFSEDRSRTNLIINYLPQSFDQTDLQRLFERVGPIRQCKLIRDKNTGASLCYGFVDFVNPQHAAVAIQTYHGYETEQKRLRVAYASSGGRRYPTGSRIPGTVGNGHPNSEITNENVIGWEVFVVGLPLDWSESSLQRLFGYFGNVILLRLLSSQLSDSPPNHKQRLGSPALNGASSDMSSDSDNGRLTATASIIFEDKTSAEQAVGRLNGHFIADCPLPLRLRLIGSVTRETFGLICLPSRHSPALGPSRLPNMPTHDPLSESDILTNLLNRKALASANCLSTTNFSKALDNSVYNGVDQCSVGGSRPIIRNKVLDNTLLNHGLTQGQQLELLDLLDNQQSHLHSHDIMNGVDGHSTRDMSVLSALQTHRSQESSVKMDSLRSSALPWTVPHRSVLGTPPEASRASDVLGNRLLHSGMKRISIKTPIIPSPILSSLVSQRNCQAHVWLKLENVQPTGSFKIRGMENACRKWASEGVTHVVCPSNGNAAVAAAYCAQAYGLTCTLVIPEAQEAGVRRRLAMESIEAKIIVHGTEWVEANQRAEQIVSDLHVNHPADPTVRLLHPFDLPELWEGYESLIEELGPEIGQPDVIVVAVGGGGLLAGVIQGLWNRSWSSTHVIAIETESSDCLNQSVIAGQLQFVSPVPGITPTLAAPILAQRTWNLAQMQSLTQTVCTDAEALDAVKHFVDDHGMLVEPACGAALSTVYSGLLSRLQSEGRIPRPANVVIIVSGGRMVSMQQLSEWETQINMLATERLSSSILSSLNKPYFSRTPPRPNPDLLSGAKQHQNTVSYGQLSQDLNETLKLDGSSTPNTPRPVCEIMHLVQPDTTTSIANGLGEVLSIGVSDRGNAGVDGNLNPHDLVNFSKLLATDADELGGSRD